MAEQEIALTLAAAGPANYNTFSVTAPLDPRLPGGGGQTISGLYDVNPTLFGQTNNLVTLASNFGNQYQHFDGLDVTFNIPHIVHMHHRCR